MSHSLRVVPPDTSARSPSLKRYILYLRIMRGIQKVCSLTELATIYAHHILSLFNKLSCNWNALCPAFLQSSDSAVEELLYLVFQPDICRADNVLNVRNFVSFHEFFRFRKQTEVTWSQDNASDHTSAQTLAVIQNAGFELLRHSPYSPFVFVLHVRLRTFWTPLVHPKVDF